ncbi:MAG: hypothetical protein ACI4MR_06520, partial [Candidatus Aphodomorpha sp.]
MKGKQSAALGLLCGASQNKETDLWLRSQVGFLWDVLIRQRPRLPCGKGAVSEGLPYLGAVLSPVISFCSCFAKGNQLLIVLWLQDNPSVTAGAVPPPF